MAAAVGRGRREAEYAARWAAGAWRGATLRAETGETYALVFEGRRGGGAGPDFRDAVLARADGARLYGDVECTCAWGRGGRMDTAATRATTAWCCTLSSRSTRTG